MTNISYSNTHQILLQLLRKALDNSNQVELPKGADWMGVLNLASEHRVHGICLVDWAFGNAAAAI